MVRSTKGFSFRKGNAERKRKINKNFRLFHDDADDEKTAHKKHKDIFKISLKAPSEARFKYGKRSQRRSWDDSR